MEEFGVWPSIGWQPNRYLKPLPKYYLKDQSQVYYNAISGASTFFDYLRTIVQLLPYYIPPVVIANLINMVFFFFLLGAVEFFPMMTGLFQRTTRTNPIFTKPTSSVVETTELEVL